MPSGLWPRAHGRGSPSLQPWSSLPSCPRVPAVPAPGVVATVPRPSSRPWLRASPPFTRRLWSTQRLTAAAVGRTLTRQSLPIRAARAPMPAPTSRRTAASRRRPKVIPAAATLSPATRRLPFRSAPNPTSVPTQRPSLMAFTRRRSKTVGCPWPSTARCCRSMPVRCGCSTGCGGTETGPGVSMPCMALRLPSGFLSFHVLSQGAFSCPRSSSGPPWPSLPWLVVRPHRAVCALPANAADAARAAPARAARAAAPAVRPVPPRQRAAAP